MLNKFRETLDLRHARLLGTTGGKASHNKSSTYCASTQNLRLCVHAFWNPCSCFRPSFAAELLLEAALMRVIRYGRSRRRQNTLQLSMRDLCSISPCYRLMNKRRIKKVRTYRIWIHFARLLFICPEPPQTGPSCCLAFCFRLLANTMLSLCHSPAKPSNACFLRVPVQRSQRPGRPTHHFGSKFENSTESFQLLFSGQQPMASLT